MNTPTEDNFRDAYAVYERNHAEQREAMLAALPQAAPIKRRLKLRPAVAALAAVLVVAFGIAGFVVHSPDASVRPRWLARTPAIAQQLAYQRIYFPANDDAVWRSDHSIPNRALLPAALAILSHRLRIQFPRQRQPGESDQVLFRERRSAKPPGLTRSKESRVDVCLSIRCKRSFPSKVRYR